MATVQTTPRSVGRPGAQEAEEITARILEVATKLFAEQGYAATSIGQVAACAGTGKHTIYRRYAAKDQLFAGVMRAQKALFVDRLAVDASSRRRPIERLCETCQRLLDLVTTDEVIAFNRINISEAKLFPEVSAELWCEESPAMDRLVALVREAQAAGELKPGDAEFTAGQLFNTVTGIPVSSLLTGSRAFADRQTREDYFQRAWNLFLHGAA